MAGAPGLFASQILRTSSLAKLLLGIAFGVQLCYISPNFVRFIHAKLSNLHRFFILAGLPYSIKRSGYLTFIYILQYGWGARIRTWGCRDQNPVPYRLATPQKTVTDSTFNSLILLKLLPDNRKIPYKSSSGDSFIPFVTHPCHFADNLSMATCACLTVSNRAKTHAPVPVRADGANSARSSSAASISG